MTAVVVLDLGRAVPPGLFVLVVDVPQQFVDQLGVIGQLPHLEDQHRGGLPVDEEHADGLVVVEGRNGLGTIALATYTDAHAHEQC